MVIKRLNQAQGVEGPDAALEATANAAVAELFWQDADARLAGCALTPLIDGETIVVALPYAEHDLARRLEAAGRATLVFSDPRLARRGWRPLVTGVDVSVRADPDGARFCDHLIAQYLQKYPPAADLIGNRILLRDHWWYVPRLLVTLRPFGPVTSLVARRDRGEALLAVADGSIPQVEAVRLSQWQGETLAPAPLDGAGDNCLSAVSALLLQHDFAVPDRMVESVYRLYGSLNTGHFHVAAREGQLGLPPRPGLIRRLLQQQRLGAACRRGLAMSEMP